MTKNADFNEDAISRRSSHVTLIEGGAELYDKRSMFRVLFTPPRDSLCCHQIYPNLRTLLLDDRREWIKRDGVSILCLENGCHRASITDRNNADESKTR